MKYLQCARQMFKVLWLYLRAGRAGAWGKGRIYIYMVGKQGEVKHIEGDVEGRSAVLVLVVRKALHDWGISEQSWERWVHESCIWRKTLSGRVHSKCEGPEVETFLSCFRIVKANVAVVEPARGEWRKWDQRSIWRTNCDGFKFVYKFYNTLSFKKMRLILLPLNGGRI